MGPQKQTKYTVYRAVYTNWCQGGVGKVYIHMRALKDWIYSLIIYSHVAGEAHFQFSQRDVRATGVRPTYNSHLEK